MKTAAAVNPYTGGLLVTGSAGNSHATVSKEIAEFFLEMGIEYVKLASSPRFQRMLSEQGEQWEISTSDELEVGVLEEQFKDVQENADQITRTKRATNQPDGWMDRWKWSMPGQFLAKK